MIDTVLSAVAARVSSLGLTFEASPVEVVVRKIAKRQRGLDPPTRIYIIKSPTPEKIVRHGGIYDKHVFLVRIVIASPNRDNQTANQDTHATWRDAIIALFASKQAAQLALNGMRDIHAQPGAWLPTEKIEEGYDYQIVETEVQIVRERGHI